MPVNDHSIIVSPRVMSNIEKKYDMLRKVIQTVHMIKIFVLYVGIIAVIQRSMLIIAEFGTWPHISELTGSHT
jgi:hypothetical protein